MRNQNRFLGAFAALAAAGLAGCLASVEPAAVAADEALPSETSALVAFAADSTRPVPARLRACDTLKARLAASADTATEAYADLRARIAHACALPPQGPKPVRPDSLRPVPPAKPDSLRPKPPVKDSLRVPPVKPDSAQPRPPKAPKPAPPRPAKDSAVTAG